MRQELATSIQEQTQAKAQAQAFKRTRVQEYLYTDPKLE